MASALTAKANMNGTTNNKGLDARMRIIIFCVTGLIFVPLLLSDCTDSADAPHAVLPFFDNNSHDSTGYDTAIYATAAPQEADIAGTWVRDEEKVSRPLSDIYFGAGAPPTKLHLGKFDRHEGNSFEVSNLPFPVEQGATTVRFVSSQGVWNTYLEGGRWRLYLHNGGGSLRADLLGTEPPYRLRIQLSDGLNPPAFVTLKRVSP